MPPFLASSTIAPSPLFRVFVSVRDRHFECGRLELISGKLLSLSKILVLRAVPLLLDNVFD